MTEHNIHEMCWAIGWWNLIHFTAAWAMASEERFDFFCEWFRYIISKIPCLHCRQHATEYVTLYPPEKATNPFYYTWEFHNRVNRRLSKVEVSYMTASHMYIGDGMPACTTCGH